MYKILEAIGVDNENIDGAAFNNFIASSQSGIIRGILDECTLIKVNSSTLTISPGELIVYGFRVKLNSEYTIQQAASVPDIDYQIIARITLTTDRSVTFEIVCRTPETLIQESLFKTESGTYEVEIGKFTTTSSGIKSYERTLPVISVRDAVLREILESLPQYDGSYTIIGGDE